MACHSGDRALWVLVNRIIGLILQLKDLRDYFPSNQSYLILCNLQTWMFYAFKVLSETHHVLNQYSKDRDGSYPLGGKGSRDLFLSKCNWDWVNDACSLTIPSEDRETQVYIYCSILMNFSFHIIWYTLLIMSSFWYRASSWSRLGDWMMLWVVFGHWSTNT